MTYSILLAMLLAIGGPQNQKLPNEFYELPKSVTAQATLIVTGTYRQGRSPYIFMPDGTIRYARGSWFIVTRIHRGKVGGKSVAVNDTMLPKSRYVTANFEEGRSYLLLLRPSVASMKAIRTGQYVPVWESLHDDEIIGIVALK